MCKKYGNDNAELYIIGRGKEKKWDNAGFAPMDVIFFPNRKPKVRENVPIIAME